jgi:hypothetical protein
MLPQKGLPFWVRKSEQGKADQLKRTPPPLLDIIESHVGSG